MTEAEQKELLDQLEAARRELHAIARRAYRTAAVVDAVIKKHQAADATPKEAPTS